MEGSGAGPPEPPSQESSSGGALTGTAPAPADRQPTPGCHCLPASTCLLPHTCHLRGPGPRRALADSRKGHELTQQLHVPGYSHNVSLRVPGWPWADAECSPSPWHSRGAGMTPHSEVSGPSLTPTLLWTSLPRSFTAPLPVLTMNRNMPQVVPTHQTTGCPRGQGPPWASTKLGFLRSV